MEYRLSFPLEIKYNSGKEGIAIELVLKYGGAQFLVGAKLDTGVSHCLFERVAGEVLGIDIQSGIPATFATATGLFQAYGHEVTIQIENPESHSLVYFFADPGIQRNVLGRRGWLDRHRIGIVDYESTLYLGSY